MMDDSLCMVFVANGFARSLKEFDMTSPNGTENRRAAVIGLGAMGLGMAESLV
jgi:hypothetical protein